MKYIISTIYGLLLLIISTVYTSANVYEKNNNNAHIKPCTKEYAPVCAKMKFTGKNKTFPTLCVMQNNPNAKFLYKGACKPIPVSKSKIYEDAEDGKTSRWIKSAEAEVNNIFDAEKNSKVIELIGNGRYSNYLLGSRRSYEDRSWNDKTHGILNWSMKMDEKYKIVVYTQTQKGLRTFYLNHKKNNRKHFSKKYIRIGLGSKSMNGQWQNFSVDLKKELQKIEPDNTLLSVSGIKIKGSGRFDNIGLHLAKKVHTVCPTIYNPVCASVQIQCITTPCKAVNQTFSNSCVMKSNSLAKFLYSGSCLPSTLDEKEKLLKHSRLWTKQALKNYTFLYNTSSFAPIQPLKKVVVENNKVTSVTSVLDIKPHNDFINPINIKNVRSINQYFTLIKDTLKNKQKKITVNYDKELGYPTRISINFTDKRIMDAGITYTIKNVRKLK